MSNDLPLSPSNPFRLAIVGHGFVGQAVEYAFTHPFVDFKLIDPKYNTSVDDLKEYDPHCAFICAPTPSLDDGNVDSSIVEESVLKCLKQTNALVAVKSTITPDVITRLYNTMGRREIDRFVYNPEFLTEKNADAEFCNPSFMVFGGIQASVSTLIDFFHYNTYVKLPKNTEDDGGIHAQFERLVWIHDRVLDSQWIPGFTMICWVHDDFQIHN